MHAIAKSPTAVYYEAQNAYFGPAIFLESRNQLVSQGPNYRTLDASVGNIATQAWQRSEWLNMVVSARRVAEIQQTGRIEPLASSLQQGVHTRGSRTWYAIDYSRFRERPADLSIATGLRRFIGVGIPAESILGLSVAYNDVSGNALEKLGKRMFQPSKVYAKVSDVNVMPHKQGFGLGAALFYRSLGDFDFDQRATVYTAEANGGLINVLMRLGYKKTGTHRRDNLVEGAAISEVRLQAETVGQVRAEMYRRHRWLDNAIVLDT